MTEQITLTQERYNYLLACEQETQREALALDLIQQVLDDLAEGGMVEENTFNHMTDLLEE